MPLTRPFAPLRATLSRSELPLPVSGERVREAGMRGTMRRMDPNIRQYAADARSTDTFGRVLCSARTNHFIVDGPVQNGCPGEAITPPEAFLAGVAACGIELLQVIGRETGVPVRSAHLRIEGAIDRGKPVRAD